MNEINSKEEWIVYTDNEVGFTIKYPKAWLIERADLAEGRTFIGFGPLESRSGGTLWGIEVYERDVDHVTDVELIINAIGKQFSDRNETRKNVTIGSLNALLVTVTTQKFEDWISKTVIIESPRAIYSISNGAIDDERFNNFYESFELL